MVKVPINPAVLDWALRDASIPLAEASRAIDVPVGTLQQWLRGQAQPNKTQVGALARLLATLARDSSFSRPCSAHDGLPAC